MAKKRFTDIEIWDKEWFMALSPKHKCLIKYLFDKCDASGVWTPNWRLASMQIGETVSLDDMKEIPKDQWELLGSKIFFPDFIKFQYGNLSDKSPAHKPIFSLIIKNNISNRVFNRVSNTLQDKEEDKEKEMDKEKESDTLKMPFTSDKFQILWQNWKDYRLKEFKKKFKSIQSEQAALSHLVKLSGGIEQTAIEVISQSMANQWQGLFEVKNNVINGSNNFKKSGNKADNQQVHQAFNEFYSTKEAV